MSDHEERQAAEAAQKAASLLAGLEKPQMLEELKLLAQFRRAKYNAYTSAGFNPGQALYLCAQN